MKRKVRPKGIRVSLKNLEGDRKRIAKCKTGDGENKGVSGRGGEGGYWQRMREIGGGLPGRKRRRRRRWGRHKEQ